MILGFTNGSVGKLWLIVILVSIVSACGSSDDNGADPTASFEGSSIDVENDTGTGTESGNPVDDDRGLPPHDMDISMATDGTQYYPQAASMQPDDGSPANPPDEGDPRDPDEPPVIENSCTSSSDLQWSYMLRWQPPGSREDGTDMGVDVVDSYRVLYGSISGRYQEDRIVEAGHNEVMLEYLVCDTYYLVLTSIDVKGRESKYSNELVINRP